MSKATLDIVAVKATVDLIDELFSRRYLDLEHKLMTEQGAKFYSRNGRSYLNLTGIRVDGVKDIPNQTLVRNWAAKARRELMKVE